MPIFFQFQPIYNCFSNSVCTNFSLFLYLDKNVCNNMEPDIKLQVLICTYGEEGIKRVIECNHQPCEGVEYLVSWQQPDTDIPVPTDLIRDDFKIAIIKSKGLSKNRNASISMATAPLLLLSDDDIRYMPKQLKTIIDSFDKHPDTDIITFKLNFKGSLKHYPSHSFNLKKPAKGYYVGTPELAFRRSSIQGTISFNEYFGIGAMFPIGEEDIFIQDCMNHNLKGIFLPIAIGTHPTNTSSDRLKHSSESIQTKGAVFLHVKPKSWLPRMIVHAIRYRDIEGKRKIFWYIRQWLSGIRKAIDNNAF